MISFNQIGFLPSTNIVFGDSAEGRFTYSTGFYYSVGISNDIVNMPSISLNTSMVNANLPSVGSQNNVIESDGFNLYYNPLANSKRHRLSYLDDLNKPINLRYGNYSENSYNSNTNYRTPSIKGSVNFFTGSTLNLSIINNGNSATLNSGQGLTDGSILVGNQYLFFENGINPKTQVSRVVNYTGLTIELDPPMKINATFLTRPQDSLYWDISEKIIDTNFTGTSFKDCVSDGINLWLLPSDTENFIYKVNTLIDKVEKISLNVSNTIQLILADNFLYVITSTNIFYKINVHSHQITTHKLVDSILSLETTTYLDVEITQAIVVGSHLYLFGLKDPVVGLEHTRFVIIKVSLSNSIDNVFQDLIPTTYVVIDNLPILYTQQVIYDKSKSNVFSVFGTVYDALNNIQVMKLYEISLDLLDGTRNYLVSPVDFDYNIKVKNVWTSNDLIYSFYNGKIEKVIYDGKYFHILKNNSIVVESLDTYYEYVVLDALSYQEIYKASTNNFGIPFIYQASLVHTGDYILFMYKDVSTNTNYLSGRVFDPNQLIENPSSFLTNNFVLPSDHYEVKLSSILNSFKLFYMDGELYVWGGRYIQKGKLPEYRTNKSQVKNDLNKTYIEKGIVKKGKEISSDYIIRENDNILLVNTNTPITLTLPDPLKCKYQEFVIKDNLGTANNHNITIVGNIEDVISLILNTKWSKVTLYSNGSSWRII